MGERIHLRTVKRTRKRVVSLPSFLYTKEVFMFVLVAYDVSQKRVGKVMRICRKYLVHIQKSVFEGQLTEVKLKRLKLELGAVINTEEDAICIYRMESLQFLNKEQIGVIKHVSNTI